MKAKRDESIQNILKSFVKQKPISKGYNEIDFKKFWAEHMGETMNRYTKSIRLRNEVLTVEISSIALRTELQYDKSKLLKLVQEEFGHEKVRELRII